MKNHEKNHESYEQVSSIMRRTQILNILGKNRFFRIFFQIFQNIFYEQVSSIVRRTQVLNILKKIKFFRIFSKKYRFVTHIHDNSLNILNFKLLTMMIIKLIIRQGWSGLSEPFHFRTAGHSQFSLIVFFQLSTFQLSD